MGLESASPKCLTAEGLLSISEIYQAIKLKKPSNGIYPYIIFDSPRRFESIAEQWRGRSKIDEVAVEDGKLPRMQLTYNSLDCCMLMVSLIIVRVYCFKFCAVSMHLL